MRQWGITAEKSMKKSIMFFMVIALGVLCLTSCKSSDSGPDARDLLLGSYSYTMTGSYVMSVAGQNINIPIASGGVLRISKDGSGNRIKLTGEGMTSVSTGVVEGDVLQLDPESETQTKDGVTIILTSVYEPAQLVNNKLTINAKLSGSVAGGGQAGSIDGSFVINATKQ